MAKAGAAKPGRGAGRPSIGRRVLITLTEAQIATAAKLGNGVVAAGVRSALDMAARPTAPGNPPTAARTSTAASRRG